MFRQRQSVGLGSATRTHLGISLFGLTVAIAAPFMVSSVSRAQQALPPPPTIPGASMELPSLAPVPPPNQGVSVAPLPQESIYQAPAPLPGMAPTMAPGAFPGATVTPPMGMSPQMGAPQMRASYYQVVVPTRPENFATIANKMLSMGVRPDAIQARRAPIGPHLAVGPFVDIKEAESVSSYLRAGGMDARVFFQR